MKIEKVVIAALITVCAGALVFAQSTEDKKNSTTVENEYLSSAEDDIITDLTNSDDRDSQELALDYLEEAVKNGRTSPDMQVALDHLAGEGVSTVTRTNGRTTNNYPDIRRRACELLGQIDTDESRQTLRQTALSDNEPMVINAAIRGLGDIGGSSPEEARKCVEAIAWTQKKNAHVMQNSAPSSLAFEVLVAYEKLAPNLDDAERRAVTNSVAEIYANPGYIKPVKAKAKALLDSLQGR